MRGRKTLLHVVSTAEERDQLEQRLRCYDHLPGPGPAVPGDPGGHRRAAAGRGRPVGIAWKRPYDVGRS